MSNHYQTTPKAPYYHRPHIPARKPVLDDYDGPTNRQKALQTSEFHPSTSNSNPSNLVPGPSQSGHNGKKLSLPASAIAQALAREAARTRCKEHKEHKKHQLKEEKARKRWLGGVAWGFDPKAGLMSSKKVNDVDGGCYVIAGRSLRGFEGVDELDEVWRRTGRRWVNHSLWGIERGGPGREGKYGHGSLRNRGPSLDVPTGSSGSRAKKALA